MAQWWRSWHGAPTDIKYISIARRAGVAPVLVSAVMWAILDYASQAKDRGCVADFDCETYADFAGCDVAQVEAVIEAMTAKGIIIDGRLAAWDKRQPAREDDSAMRVAFHREKQHENNDVTQCNAMKRIVTHGNAGPNPCNTLPQRVTQCNNTEQNRTDTEQNRTDTAANAAGADCAAPPPQPASEEGSRRGRPRKNSASAPEKPPDPTMTHWAIADYRDRFHLTPPLDVRRAIIATVTDRDRWGHAMLGWTMRGGKPLNVAGILRCYQVGFDDYASTARGNGHPVENAGIAAVRLLEQEDAAYGDHA